MEIAEPTIARGFALCVEQGATTVVAHPFMLAPGRHVSEDIPRLLAASAAAHPGTKFMLTDPLGGHPQIVDIVTSRFQEAIARSRSAKE